MKSLIDSDLFAVLAWKSKRRTLKYFVIALIACLLNFFCHVSITMMVLMAILILRGPRMVLNLLAAKRASKSDQAKEEWQKLMREQTENDDFELISEDNLA